MTTRDEWLAARRKGLGGSDVAAVLGVSPWTDPFVVWLDKTGQLPDADETGAMRRGRLFEDAVAQWYAEETGAMLSPGDLTTGPEPWMLGTPDRIASVIVPHPDGGTRPLVYGLEVKTAGGERDGWGESGADVPMGQAHTVVPVYYVTQCLWYCEVCGLDRWDVAVYLRINDDFRRYTLRRDQALGAQVVARCRAWWQRHIVEGVEPPLTGHSAAHDYLLRRHPAPTDDVRAASADEAAAVAELAAAKTALAEATARESAAAARVKAAIGDAGGLVGEWGRVTWSAVNGRAGFDAARLRKERPDVAAEYATQGAPTRALRVDWRG